MTLAQCYYHITLRIHFLCCKADYPKLVPENNMHLLSHSYCRVGFQALISCLYCSRTLKTEIKIFSRLVSFWSPGSYFKFLSLLREFISLQLVVGLKFSFFDGCHQGLLWLFEATCSFLSCNPITTWQQTFLRPTGESVCSI